MKKICIVIIALLYLTLASCGWLLNYNLNDDTDIVYTTTITGQVTTDSTSSLIFSVVDESILSSCDTTLTTGVPGLAIEIIDTVNGESFECTQGAVITDDTGCYSCTITEINDNVMLIASLESDAENSHYGTHVNLDDCSIGKDCEANVDAQSTILVSLLKETFYTIAESTTLNIDCLSVVEIDNIHSDMETYHTELEDSLGNYPLTSEDETEIMTIDSEESSNMLISQIEYIQSIFYDQFPTTNTEFDTLHDFREDLSEQVTLTLQCEDDDNDGIVNRYDDDDDGDGVLDEVDNDPVLSGETTYLLMENITNVGIYTATDSDNDTLTFSLAGDDADFFVFNDSTNLLSFINVADYETQVTYNIILTVSDGVNSRSLPIVVVLEDENDNVITIESSDIFSINENETHIGYLVATDTNEETLNYSLYTC